MNQQYCSVSICKNTAKNNPSKIFFSLPTNHIKRTLWLKAIGRSTDFSEKSHLCVCEDHFNLIEDMENYYEFKLMGSRKRMKPNVVPHIAIPSSPAKQMKLIPDVFYSIPSTSYNNSAPTVPTPGPQKSTSEIGIQVCSHRMDISVQVRPYFRSKQTQCALTNIKDLQCLPLKTVTIGAVRINDNIEAPTQKDAHCKVLEENEKVQDMIFRIETNPQIYLGLPKECYFILQVLQTNVQCDFLEMLIVLKKIKTNNLYVQLGRDFRVSTSVIHTIFSEVLSKIAGYMLNLILWPKITDVPVSFRAQYNTVQCIINTFEIEIENPYNPTHQFLTWSHHRKCYTIKYLISCTPNGIVNFVSTGFGGRTSDTVLVEKSSFLAKLSPGYPVLADKAFQHIEPLLEQKKCALIRPPTVTSRTLSKNNVLTKKIASLRVHIDRIVSRIHEFEMLKPNAVLDHSILSNVDNIVVIACGLINLQNSIIK